MDLLDELCWRGLVHDSTDEAALRAALAEPLSLYCGFDPTSTSLHVGSLVPLVTLERFRRAGHHVVALVGGATALVGDPSGRRSERPLASEDVVSANAAALAAQLRRLGFEDVRDNSEWFTPMSALTLLRDVGKHFSVSEMLARDSVASRLGEGISFTEFAYSLLQANDFVHLARSGVSLQVGGSDQWGNITAGTSLVRKVLGRTVHGLTFPLLTTSAGVKMGKTAEGAVWLDAGRTSELELFQFLLRVEDVDAGRMLRWLTFLEPAELEELDASVASDPASRRAQHALASEVVRFVHGEEGLARALSATRALFGSASADDLLAAEGTVRLPAALPAPLVDLLVATGLCSSRGDARRLAAGGGARVNGVPVPGDRLVTSDDLVEGRVVQLSSGRRRHALVVPA